MPKNRLTRLLKLPSGLRSSTAWVHLTFSQIRQSDVEYGAAEVIPMALLNASDFLLAWIAGIARMPSILCSNAFGGWIFGGDSFRGCPRRARNFGDDRGPAADELPQVLQATAALVAQREE